MNSFYTIVSANNCEEKKNINPLGAVGCNLHLVKTYLLQHHLMSIMSSKIVFQLTFV